MDFSSDGLVLGGDSVHLREESGLAQDRRLVTIDELPDDVLVEIFFYVNTKEREMHDQWHTLVHVCCKWRCLVFASPRRLNLRLEYRGCRPISEVPDAWRVLPMSLISPFDPSNKQWDNMVAALESEHSNRICDIDIKTDNSHWEGFTEAMQKPFPELTHLEVWTPNVVPVLPESFLGGSAPRLQTLALGCIPFPSIPKLLLSAHRLVKLTLWNIPDSGYFSPDALANSLAVMTRLESLCLLFLPPGSRPDPETRSLPPPTRFVLPALTRLQFIGAYEYSEDLLARINAPLLNYLSIHFFMGLDFDVPQLHRFIGHVEEFRTFGHADMSISNFSIQLRVYPNTGPGSVDRRRQLVLGINCPELNSQLSSLAQICSPSFPIIFALEELQIREDSSLLSSHWKDNMENAQWLELLHPFTALKNLYLTSGVAQHFSGALRELSGERATEVLPALRNLFVRDFSSLEHVQEAMKPFVAARQLSGHPVVVDDWEN